MASQSNMFSPETTEYYKEYSWDVGTSKFAAAYVICRSRDGSRIGTPKPIRFRGKGCEIPMIATWDDEGKLIYGWDLESMESRDYKISAKVLASFKLGLYPNGETQELREEIEAILKTFPGEKTLDMLLEELLRALAVECEQALQTSEEKVKYGKDVLAKMPYKVRISTPQIFPPEARRRIQLAAKKAGLPMVALALEPQSALSYHVTALADDMEQIDDRLLEGSKILVADIGCGTGDFVLYECEEALRRDSRFKAINQSTGALCGSNEVNSLLLAEVWRASWKGWKDRAKDHGLAPEAFRRRVLQAVEEKKKIFQKDDVHWMTVKPGPGKRPFTFSLPFDVFKKAHDKVIADITSAIDSIVQSDKPDVIEVTGGFAKSAYLMDKLRERYEPQAITVVRPNDNNNAECFAVALGALYRYDNITTQTLPSRYGYAALQRGDYNPKLHTDAWTRKNGKREPKEDIVLQDPWNSSNSVVDNRLYPLIQPGTKLRAGETMVSEWGLVFWVDCNNPVVSQKFACTTQHKALSARGINPDGTYCEGVEPWAEVSVPLDPKELKRRHCAKDYEGHGTHKRWQYEISVNVLLQCVNGQDIRIGFKLNPGQNSIGRLKGRRGEDVEQRLIEEDEQNFGEYIVWEGLWDSYFSEFVDEKEPESEPMDTDGYVPERV